MAKQQQYEDLVKSAISYIRCPGEVDNNLGLKACAWALLAVAEAIHEMRHAKTTKRKRMVAQVYGTKSV